MAANPAVEKLKAFGIQHGEKVVVALTATAFVVLTGMAIFVKSSGLDKMPDDREMTSDDLKKIAGKAGDNLQAKQGEVKVLAKLESDGLKEPLFEKTIENQIANALKPGDYRAKLDWVTPEPGAGLIRDQPELIAPTDLNAFPGRGGILMYKLNDKGEREIETAEEAKKKGGRRGGASGPGMVTGPGGGGGGAPGSAKEETPEQKKARLLKEAQAKAAFTPKSDDADKEKDKDKAKEAEADAAPAGNYKEEVKGKRWIVLTAVIDNEKLKKNYLLALKNEAVAYPNYKRVDIERQTRQSDGTWTEWAKTDEEKNWAVLDNLPELEEEYVPESQRPKAICDPLPFLKAGYWTGVHVASLVPPEILDPAKKNGPGGRFPGMGPGGPGGGPAGGPGEMGGGGGASRQGGGGPGRITGGPGGNMMPGPGMGGGGPSIGGGGGGSADEMNFTKLDAPSLMIRSLDFTVEPDTTYRFRIRIVVVNPNLDHTDVNPGVDVDSKELLGPWSEPSDAVTVPADVAAYTQAPEPATRRDDLVTFQVIRWDPNSGQTVVKTDIAGPGEIIGEYGTVQMPTSDGSGAKSTPIDFNSRAIVLDTFGGRQRMPDIGLERNPFEVPAIAMIVEPDGSVVIRSQAHDRADEVRKDMDANYKLAVEESNKAREKGKSSRMPGNRGRNGKKRRQSGGGQSRQGGS